MVDTIRYLSSKDEQNRKIENKALAIINSFQEDSLDANVAMDTISLAIILVATTMDMSKEEVMSNLSNHWDKVDKGTELPPITYSTTHPTTH